MAQGSGKLIFEDLADTKQFLLKDSPFSTSFNALLTHALLGLSNADPEIRAAANRFLASDFTDFPSLCSSHTGLICEAVFELTLVIDGKSVNAAQYCKEFGDRALQERATEQMEMSVPLNSDEDEAETKLTEIIDGLIKECDDIRFTYNFFEKMLTTCSLRELLKNNTYNSVVACQVLYAAKIISEQEKKTFPITASPELIQTVLWPKVSRMRLIYRRDHNFSTAVALRKNIERLKFLGYREAIDVIYYNDDRPDQATNIEKLALVFPEPVPGVTFIGLDCTTGDILSRGFTGSIPAHLTGHGYTSHQDIPYAPLTLTHYTYGSLGMSVDYFLNFSGTQIDLNSNCPEFPHVYMLPAINFADGRTLALAPKQHDPLSYLPSELALIEEEKTAAYPYTWADYLSQHELPYDSMVVRALIGHLNAAPDLQKSAAQRLLNALLTRERPVLLFSSESAIDRGYFAAQGLLNSAVILLRDTAPSSDFRISAGAKVIIIELGPQRTEVFARMIELSTLPYLGMGSMTFYMRKGKIVLSARALAALPDHVMHLYDTADDEYSKKIYQASLALSSPLAPAQPLNELLQDFNKDSAAVATAAGKIQEALNSHPDQLCAALTYLSEHPEEILTESQYKEAARKAMIDIFEQASHLENSAFFQKKLRLLGSAPLRKEYLRLTSEKACTALDKSHSSTEIFQYLKYFLCETDQTTIAFHELLLRKFIEVAHKNLSLEDKAFVLLFISHYRNSSCRIDSNFLAKSRTHTFLILSLAFLLDKSLLLAGKTDLTKAFHKILENIDLNSFYYLMIERLLFTYNRPYYDMFKEGLAKAIVFSETQIQYSTIFTSLTADRANFFHRQALTSG